MNQEKPPRRDSYVREHLANERTFLAWIRTALALMGFGVVIARLRWLIPSPSPVHSGTINVLTLGLMLSLLGVATVVFALCHFLATRRALENDDYQPLGASIIAIGILIIIVGIGIVFYLLKSASIVAPATQLS